MRTSQKLQRGQSLNAERNPYMRDDFWASGYFDFLWKSGITKSYRERLDAIKRDAMKSNKNFQHRPAVKSVKFLDNTIQRNHQRH